VHHKFKMADGFVCLFVCSLRVGVQPTLDSSTEAVSRPNALAPGREGIGWCVRNVQERRVK